MVEAVPRGRVERGHDERVLGRHAERHSVANDRVHVPLLGDVLRLAVVGAEGEPMRPELGDERERARAGFARPTPRGSAPTCRPAAVPALPRACTPRGRTGFPRLRTLAGACRGRRGRGRRRARPRRSASLASSASSPAMTPGKFIISASPITRRRLQQALEVARRQRSARRLEGRGRHARRGHEPDVERQPGADVEQPVDAVRAEHVRDLVRVGDDGRRARAAGRGARTRRRAASSTRGACVRR